jgi:flagellar biosynthesis protein FlhA
MSDSINLSNTKTISNGFDLAAISQRTDLMFALAFMAVLAVLIMPLPKFMLDSCLAISIAFSFMILMTALFIEKPLEFSSFPTILLVATMLRLSLNVASTRLILSHGHEGTNAAGRVIEAFGHFVMGGNFVIGIIVFIILLIVNFIVITKGSSRIAEVSARFSLDAMPGKQMAVDADLSSGLIDEDEAKRRRKELEGESNFFGSMDGAAKFVRGDAIAGLLITLINIIGGIIIGVVQQGVSLADAAHSYIILSVGDGLVTQIPAIIVSTSAGMMVSKAGVEGTADKAMFQQLSANPSSLGMSSFLMGCIALLPGMPILPFLSLSALTGFAAWFINEKQKNDKETINKQEKERQTKETEKKLATQTQDDTLNPVDSIRIEMGFGLLSLLNGDAKRKSLSEQIKVLRKQMLGDIGIILPSVRIQDNLQLNQEAYSIKIKEIEAGSGTLRPNHYLVMDPEANDIHIPGEKTTEPSFGLPALWVAAEYKDQAEEKQYTVVDPAMVLATHLSEIVKDNIGELLSYGDVQKVLDQVPESYKKLLSDIVPINITVGGIQRVLQSLVSERVSIRDIGTILEGIAEATGFSKNTDGIAEHVRHKLSRQISFSNLDDNGVLPILTLAQEWEEAFHRSLVGDNENRYLAMAPTESHLFMRKIADEYDRLTMIGEMPILITSSPIRLYVRSLTERVRPAIQVMSQNELHPKCKIRNLGQISMC